MTTLAHDMTRVYAAKWEDLFSSAVFAGIVGDMAHKKAGGYHISIEDQSSTNYSVTRSADKAPPGNWPRNLASAVDMSMSTADMITMWNRVYAVWLDQTDPRREYFNAFNGWNGKGDAERLDFVANTRNVASSDHKSHCHDETKRCYAGHQQAYTAKLSVFAGETKAQYLHVEVKEVDEMKKMFVRGFNPDPKQVWLVYENGTRRKVQDSWFDGAQPGDNKGAITNWQIHAESFMGNTTTVKPGTPGWERDGQVFVSAGDGNVWGIPLDEPLLLSDEDVVEMAEAISENIKPPTGLTDGDKEIIASLTFDSAKKAIRTQFVGVPTEQV